VQNFNHFISITISKYQILVKFGFENDPPGPPGGLSKKNFFLKKSFERIFRAKSESFVKIEAHIKRINKKNLRGGEFSPPPWGC
jgi:hypothetical protein